MTTSSPAPGSHAPLRMPIPAAAPTSATRAGSPPDPARSLRQGVLLLAAAATVGTLVELATLHHWKSTEQLIPWVVLGAALGGILSLLVHPRRGLVVAARWLSLLTLAGTALGVYQHIEGNLEAGPLDRVWGERWDSLSGAARLWHAANGDVGPAPLLASGVLAMIGLLVFLHTLGHPVLGGDGD